MARSMPVICESRTVRISQWSVKPHGAKCPGNGDNDCEKEEQSTDPANDSHQIASSNFCYKWFHTSFSPNCRASVSDAWLGHIDWRFTETPYRSVLETAARDEASVSTAPPAPG